MDQKLYPNIQPSAPDLELIIDKKIKDINSFNNSINNIMLMMKYYDQQYQKYKKKYNKYNLINNAIQTLDSITIISTTSSSITFSIIGIGVIVVPIVCGVGCSVAVLSKLLSKYIKIKLEQSLKKYTLIKETQQRFETFYSSSLKDNKINESEYNTFIKLFDTYKNQSSIDNKNKSFLDSI